MCFPIQGSIPVQPCLTKDRCCEKKNVLKRGIIMSFRVYFEVDV